MKQWKGYLIFENEEDFQKNTFSHYKDTRRVSGGIIKASIKYPACFKYFDGSEPGYMGEWQPCKMEEAFLEWEKQIQYYIEFVEECRNMIKSKSD